VRHAQASRASVSLDVSANAVTLSIADNGRGFDVERALADPRAGVGLRNMRERVDSLGGSLSLASQPGHTNVTAHVPVGPRSSGTKTL
jgi:two-component system, NarL family, sensor kinase